MQSPLTRRLAAGIAGIALTLGAHTLPAAATVHQDDLPSYTCDTAQWFNTRSARGEGDCTPSNGAPATGRVGGAFYIYGRDTPPGRIYCINNGYASTPERVSGFPCGPRKPLIAPHEGSPTYTCDRATVFNTRSARGEGDCIPSNGAPSTGYVEGRFYIHTRDVPPVRIVCGGGGTAFSIPESVTGFGCGRLSDSLDAPDSVSETGNNA